MQPYRTPGGAFLMRRRPRLVDRAARETDVTLLRGDPDGDHPARCSKSTTTSCGHEQQCRRRPTATPDNFQHGLHGLQPQSLLPLPGHAEAGQRLQQSFQRLCHLDHGGLFRGIAEPVQAAGRRWVTPTAINWARSWAATAATSSAIGPSTSSTARSPWALSAARTSIRTRRCC